MKFHAGFDAGGSLVSAGGTGKETIEAGVGNDTDNEGGIVSDAVGEACVEKYETNSNTKYFLMEGL